MEQTPSTPRPKESGVRLHEILIELAEVLGAEEDPEAYMWDVSDVQDWLHEVADLMAALPSVSEVGHEDANQAQDARRGRFLVKHGAWLRFGVDQESEEDRSAALAVRVPFKTDLSTVATREDAVDAAIEAAEQATSEAHGNG
ncbi:hypothetical protein TK90_2637 (plasmid) [Thioalkalivibrio sp. K90mix]|uniref:hypothetical protein n=1 Tax=Thioalkalivibrio sp. (strain K90mix) TaxID=396595 RepID=UPI000195AB99|nr:hypothetical protein [Thioalkalivibrio sp. K90mix]ADC73124.1 hypothetical protein TK90_2637 [Thioalkalivibrio sp. K90mix]